MASGSGDLAEIVTTAWVTALSLETADRGGSFLSQGGDSLRAMDLRARLLETVGYAPELPQLLACGGLAQLIEAIRRECAQRPASISRMAAPAASAADPDSFSFAQERLAFMHELAGATAAYHVAQASRLTGPLNAGHLRQAYHEVCGRHAELRRAATLIEGRIRQAGRIAAAPDWREIDWPAVGQAGGDPCSSPAVQDWLSEFTNAPIQLERGPLVRAALIRFSTSEAVLLVVAHHAVLDQWALETMLRDVGAAYRCLSLGERRTESAPPCFASYAQWHRGWLSGNRRDVELQYWITRLRGVEPTSLPEDYARPPQQSYRGARERIDLHLRDIAALRRFGAAQGATLAMVLLAALKLLLARYAATQDVVVGMPVAGRHHPHARRQVGPLINTLVIRSRIDVSRGLQHALTEVRLAMLEALAHQDVPFDQVVQALRISRDPSRSPLFGVMFNMLNTPFTGMDLPSVKWSRVEFDKSSAQFDLQVTVDALHSRAILLEYSTDLYARDSIMRFASQYRALLKDVAAGRHGPLNLTDGVDPEEFRFIREQSQGVRIGRTSGTIPDLLTPTFARAGPSVALRCGDEVMTYAQLSTAVQQVAAALRLRGVGRGTLIGLCVDRSPQLVIGLLAILEVGAAYVPLDPSYPAERLAFMAKDAAIALLLHGAQLPTGIDWPALPCGSLSIHATLADGARPVAAALSSVSAPRPMDPAYVIYTSGSTGRPKGVVVQHFAVVNFLRSMARSPGLSAGDRLLAITTPSFDIAVLELLLPLFIGAKIVLATAAEQSDGEQLQQLLARRRITVLQATPSTWRMLIDTGWRGTPGLRALVGGESLSRGLAIELIGRCAEVWNMYGPTEATVWATCHRIESVGPGRIPIGRPIANSQALVLDDDGGLCPIGVPGEIHLGGDCLAMGYLNQPELTAMRFVPNRYSRDRRASRLYRTGDRGRLRSDGLLEHLGRCDDQLKIRGHRIEPGEIESRLRQIPGVTDAAVVGIEFRDSDVRLAAYLVRTGGDPDAASVRTAVRAWLPDYMVPQHVVFVDTIPLTPNGKVDRAALPRPSWTEGNSGVSVPPRSRLERAVWGVWRETIGLDSFGITDNFFDLGGHSLLAVQLVSRIRSELGVQCTLVTLFSNPTVEALSAALQSPASEGIGAVVPLNASERGPSLFCLCGVTLYQTLADHLEGHMRVLGLHVPKELITMESDDQTTTDQPSVERLASEYVKLIRAQQPRGPYALCGFSFGGVVAYEVARVLSIAGEHVSRLWILDSDVPGPPRARSTAALRGGARKALRRLKDSLRSAVNRSDDGESDANLRYLAVMHQYQPSPAPVRVVLVQSQDLPTYDSGNRWSDLAADVIELAVDTDHLGVLSETGVTQWAAAALSADR